MNWYDINITFWVSKLLRSTDFNDVQSLIMLVMLYTLEVLKLLRSRDVNDAQP